MTDDPKENTRKIVEKERAEALAAMMRARRHGEKLARDTGTMLIQAVDGKPVRDPPPTES